MIDVINLSIIIPHYNTPDLLKLLLDSIPVYDSIQVIVVDDKSNQNKGKYDVLRDNSDYEHVTFIDNKTDKKSAGTCRNIGLEHATGEWVLFADADDYFADNFYDIIKKYTNSEYEVVLFPHKCVYSDTGESSAVDDNQLGIINNYLKNPTKKNELYIRYRIYTPWSKLIRKSFIEKNKILFDETKMSNDVMFSAKTGFYMSSFFVAGDVIYMRTINKGSLINTLTEEALDIRLNVFIDYCYFLKQCLPKKDFRMLNINGTHFIIKAIKFKLGFKKIIEIILKLRKHKIAITDKRLFNLDWIFKQAIKQSKHSKSRRNYYVYKK